MLNISGFSYHKLINFVLFQVIWFVCVVYQNPGLYLAIPCLLILLLTSSLANKTLSQDIKFVVLLAVLGILIDGSLIQTGVFILLPQAEPAFWLLVIWLGFALTLNHSLKPIVSKPLIATLAGAVFGPLAYYTGKQLGAIEFGWSTQNTVIMLACIWSLVMLLLSFLVTINKKGA